MNEQQHQPPDDDERWQDEWDCTPRDGPAAFVVDALALDAHGARKGRWLDPTRDPDEVRADLAEAIGTQAAEHDEWSVIDQVGLGGTMLPEHIGLDALARMARRQAGRPR